jgi:flagellar basal-body rod protein FlgB
MDLRKIPLFDMMARRMAWLGARQQVISQNIANADTPGYKPRDLKPLDFRTLAEGHASMEVTPVQTSPLHLAGFSPGGQGAKAEKERHPIETTISGNSVTLEEELMKANQASTDYELTTNLYRKHIQMIKDALGRPGS